MSPRRTRRAAVVVVALLGLIDVVLAATPHPHSGPRVRPGFSLALAFGGPRYLLLMAGGVLLAVAPGLRAGKQNAWRIAVAVSALSLVGHQLRAVHVVGSVVAGLAIGILLVGRASFAVPSDPPRATQGWWLLGLGELAVFAYAAGGLWLLNAEFRHAPNAFEALVGGVRLLLLLPISTLGPMTPHARWFSGSVRFLSLLVVFAGLARVLTPAVIGPSRRAADRRRVEQLLDQWATSTLAFFHLLPDKTWFFAGDAFLSYRVSGRVAVVMGGPVGEPAARERVVDEFLERCELNGWIPAFDQVGEDERPLLEGRGFTLLKVGEEPIVDLDAFSLDVPGRKSLRSALRRVERSGHRAEELARPIDDDTMRELRAVSDAWLESGGHRERTFTLGQFDPAYLRATRVIAVRDASGRIVAFANVVPSYRSPVGNFDLMRRRPDAVNGVMDFLLAGLLERFRAEGRHGMALGLAPLANVRADGVVGRSLRLLRDHGRDIFNFEGLYSFKAKWATSWQPRYLAYRERANLPRIGLGLRRVGEVGEPASARARAAALVHRLPFATALLSVQLWLMAATTVNPPLQRFLLRHFGLSWPDLVHGQWWRVATSTVIEPRGGVIVSNLVLIGVVAAAEWRFGSRRTVAGFFLGDWLSTLPILAVLRLLGAAGSTAALAAATTHDAGPSSAAYALSGIVVCSIPDRRLRAVAVSAVLASLMWPLVRDTRLFEVQHLVALMVGVALGSSTLTRWMDRHRGRSTPRRCAMNRPRTGLVRPPEGPEFGPPAMRG